MTDPERQLLGMSVCDHVAIVTVAEGRQFVSEILCPCRDCGELVAFKINGDAAPRLRLVADLPPSGEVVSPTQEKGSENDAA